MQCTITQSFAANANPSYKSGKLSGHPGCDAHCGYGTDVLSKYRGTAYKVLATDTDSLDGTGFTGVFMIVDDGVECFEMLVGHLTSSIGQGDFVEIGQKIGTEANHGTVYQGGVQITLAMQRAGDKRGSHRHYQKRAVMPVKRTEYGKHYLTAQGTNSPYYNPEKQCYYEIINYNAGYNGCVDPLQPVFTRTLTLGMSGYDVFVLQRILARRGYLQADPTGYFGILTASALQKWQSANGLTPFPIFGPKSRQLALRECAPLPVLTGN